MSSVEYLVRQTTKRRTKNPVVILIDETLKGICPVCKKPYRDVTGRKIGDTMYYYCEHYIKKGEEILKKDCCIGPLYYQSSRKERMFPNPKLIEVIEKLEKQKEKSEEEQPKKKKRKNK